MSAAIDLAAIDRLTNGRIGQFDIPCPLCSPRRKAKNRRLKVLRIWRTDENFAGYSCIHCGEKGFARDKNAPPPDLGSSVKAIEQPAQDERTKRAKQIFDQ